jgi:hypothetical protein
MTMKSRLALSMMGVAALVLSLGAGCARSSGAGAFFILVPRWMKAELPGPLAPRIGGAGATGRVDSMRGMRAAEGERRLEALSSSAAHASIHPALSPTRGDFEGTWMEAGRDEARSVSLVLRLPGWLPFGRVSIATGYDPISPKWDERFWLDE